GHRALLAAAARRPPTLVRARRGRSHPPAGVAARLVQAGLQLRRGAREAPARVPVARTAGARPAVDAALAARRREVLARDLRPGPSGPLRTFARPPPRPVGRVGPLPCLGGLRPPGAAASRA